VALSGTGGARPVPGNTASAGSRRSQTTDHTRQTETVDHGVGPGWFGRQTRSVSSGDRHHRDGGRAIARTNTTSRRADGYPARVRPPPESSEHGAEGVTRPGERSDRG